MSEDDTLRTARWSRIETPVVAAEDAIRAALKDVRKAPNDGEPRRVLRALAAELGNWDELALLLADEARGAKDPAVALAFYEELADVHDNLDQPLETIAVMEAVVALEPGEVAHHDRLARLYHGVGAWSKAAEAFERVAELATDGRARAALLAAGRLYRDNGRTEPAIATYRRLLERRAHDVDALHALDELLASQNRWAEVAEIRGALADRAPGGLEKAALLRAQARALEGAGKTAAAAELVARAAGHAPEDVSGLVDYAQVLAREGKATEAADLLRKRVDEADEDARAGLRMRLATVLDDIGDRAGAHAVLRELIAEAPDHVPALERLMRHAADAGEPKAHAEAVVRYAEYVAEPMDRAALLVEAARKFRVVGEHRAAAKALEAACVLAPGDRDLEAELEDSRTTLALAQAAGAAERGNPDAAMRGLRIILESHPHHVATNLALVDLLEKADRLDAASEHLQMTLATAPEDLAPDRLARLVFRYAQVRAALQDPDEAHQLLHEAHRLDRKDLPITLALGESCFARRLWREAAINLGSLAEHPQAKQHALGVAAGLVKAAQAEVRALRPQHAAKHYLAATKLDPSNSKAWHALAELAIEKDDMPKAAEYLEREAAAATEPAEKLRILDALGDLALEVLEDPARAERCWSQLADAGPLGKLLDLQRARGATTARGETCAKLAELDPARSEALLVEAIDAFVAGGDAVRAIDAARALAARHPASLDAIVAASALTGALEPEAFKRVVMTADLTDGRATLLWARLGDAERARGNDRGARTAYDKAIAGASGGHGQRSTQDKASASTDRGGIGIHDAAGPTDAERSRGGERATNAKLDARLSAAVAPGGPPAAHDGLAADGVLIARRGIVELAQASGTPLGAHSLAAIVAVDPRPAEILAWARELAATDPVDARAAFELALGVGARLTDDDQRFLTAHPVRPMASDEAYAAPLDDADRRALIDDPDDAPLGELLEILAEVAPLVCPDPQTALRDAGFADATRVAGSSDAETSALYPQIAKLLGGPPTLSFATARPHHDLALVLAAPPVVLIGPRIAGMRARSRSDVESQGPDAELRFKLGRIVELSRPRRIFAASPRFAQLVAGITSAFGVGGEPSPEADRLRAAVPMLVRRRLGEKLATIVGPLDPAGYLAACERAADRAGLLACGDASVAVALAPHLARLAASPRYFAVRRKLRRS